MSSTARDIWKEMTSAERAEMDDQLRNAGGKLAAADLLAEIRSRPGHKPYTGPPIAEAVRAQRAEREEQLDGNLRHR